MEHCPSDCHSHIITSFSDVKSGSFDAPDHEYPSHLKLSLTVTDSDGLTASDEVEIFPKTGTVAATSDPAGIPLTVSATTAIVGSSISVSAPADGGPRRGHLDASAAGRTVAPGPTACRSSRAPRT